MNNEKIKFYSHLTVAIIGALLVGYIFVKYLFLVILPFLIAWTVAFAVRPLAKRISSGTKIPYKFISATLTVLIVVGSIGIIVSAIAYAAREAWAFLSGLAESESLYEILGKVMNPLGGLFGDVEGAEEIEAKIGEAVYGVLTSLLSGLVGSLTALVSAIPRVLIFVLVTVVASIYFSLDLENVNAFVKKKLPSRAAKCIVSFKNRFLSSILKYLRSYLIIMLITFIEMLFGFLTLGVRYAVLFAFIVSLLDALPLIGVGTVLVPFSVYQLIFADMRLGIGLIILFVLHTVLRQFIEPRIVGKNLGIHPILSLVLLYFGYSFFGLFGLLLVPLFSVIVNLLLNKDNAAEVDERLVGK